MYLCIKLFQKESSLLLTHSFESLLASGKKDWKELLQLAIKNETPIPCMQAAWTYFSSLKTAKSNANIIQAQRDYFGAHGFLRIDQPKEQLQHGPWASI